MTERELTHEIDEIYERYAGGVGGYRGREIMPCFYILYFRRKEF